MILNYMKLKNPSNKNQCPSNFSVYSVYKLLHAAVYTDADFQDHMFAERDIYIFSEKKKREENFRPHTLGILQDVTVASCVCLVIERNI